MTVPRLAPPGPAGSPRAIRAAPQRSPKALRGRGGSVASAMGRGMPARGRGAGGGDLLGRPLAFSPFAHICERGGPCGRAYARGCVATQEDRFCILAAAMSQCPSGSSDAEECRGVPSRSLGPRRCANAPPGAPCTALIAARLLFSGSFTEPSAMKHVISLRSCWKAFLLSGRGRGCRPCATRPRAAGRVVRERPRRSLPVNYREQCGGSPGLTY